MKSAIPDVQSDDQLFNRYQQGLSKAMQPVFNCPVIYGQALSGIVLITGSINNVPHGLNRVLQGWFILRSRASAIFWDSQDSNTHPDQTLSLNVSANVTADIWVF